MRVCSQAFSVCRRETEQEQVALNCPARCRSYHVWDWSGPVPRTEARRDWRAVAPSIRESGDSDSPISLGRAPAAAPSIVSVAVVAMSIMRGERRSGLPSGLREREDHRIGGPSSVGSPRADPVAGSSVRSGWRARSRTRSRFTWADDTARATAESVASLTSDGGHVVVSSQSGSHGPVPSGMDDGLGSEGQRRDSRVGRAPDNVSGYRSGAHGADACRFARLEGHVRMAPMTEAMRAVRRPVL